MGAWRGLALPKDAPASIVQILGDVARKTANDSAFKDALAQANLGWAYADTSAFQARIDRDRAFYANLVPRLELKSRATPPVTWVGVPMN